MTYTDQFGVSRQGAGTDAYQKHMFAVSAVLGILANLDITYKEVQELMIANPMADASIPVCFSSHGANIMPLLTTEKSHQHR